MNKIKEFLSKFENWITIFFIAVPVGSSVLSAFHLYKLMLLGNNHFMSVSMSIIFEFGNIAIIFALVTMKKLNPVYVWITFILLVLVQYAGNIYATYDWVFNQINNDLNFLTSFLEMFSWQTYIYQAKLTLAIFLGLFPPTLSILLSKSLTDYLKKTDEPILPLEAVKSEPDEYTFASSVTPIVLEPDKNKLDVKIYKKDINIIHDLLKKLSDENDNLKNQLFNMGEINKLQGYAIKHKSENMVILKKQTIEPDAVEQLYKNDSSFTVEPATEEDPDKVFDNYLK